MEAPHRFPNRLKRITVKIIMPAGQAGEEQR
jgi:hypothetical protein